MRRNLLALLAIGLLTGTAIVSAGWYVAADAPLALTSAPLHQGDALRYTVLDWNDGSDTDLVTLVMVEGTNRTRDAYGIERETQDYLIQWNRTEDAAGLLRCHALARGIETVRTDPLDGPEFSFGHGGGSNSSGVLGLFAYSESVSIEGYETEDYRPSGCLGHLAAQRVTLTEGERVAAEAIPHLREWMPGYARLAGTSLPASRTEYEGRPALEIRFVFHHDETVTDGAGFIAHFDEQGTLTAILADGLPGLAALRLDVISNNTFGMVGGEEERFVGPWVSGLRLTGLVAGDGPEVFPDEGHRLGPAAPVDTIAYDGLRLDDRAFGFPFPYQEAFDVLLADPNAGFATYLQEHPDAVLQYADYDRRRDLSQEDRRTDGGWHLTFGDTASSYMGFVFKVRAVASPLGPIDLPAPTYDAFGSASHEAAPYPTSAPAALASSEAVAERLTQAGIAPGEVEHAEFFPESEASLSSSFLRAWRLTPVSSERPDKSEAMTGPVLTIDAETSRLIARGVVAAKYERNATGTTPIYEEALLTAGVRTESFIANVPANAGLALTTAVGSTLAALAIALKAFALPFYTRLRRDRLLDNPVRARLYECIRTNPGITRGELVDYLGIGEGATRHHVEKLMEAHLIVETESDRYVRFYCAGDLPPERALQEAVLRAGSNRRVHDLLRAEPHLSLREAATRLGMSAPSVHRSVKRLREAGLLPAVGSEAMVRPSEA